MSSSSWGPGEQQERQTLGRALLTKERENASEERRAAGRNPSGGARPRLLHGPRDLAVSQLEIQGGVWGAGLCLAALQPDGDTGGEKSPCRWGRTGACPAALLTLLPLFLLLALNPPPRIHRQKGVCVCKSLSHVPMSSLHVLCDPVHCSPPGSSVYGISAARILERFAISSSRGSSQLRDQACGSGIGRQVLYP